MAQNFMCDTVALDAPHSDGWEETESPVDEFLLAGGFSKGEGSSARTVRSPPQSPPRLQPNAHQLPDHHNLASSSATTFSPGANRASYFARQYLVSAEDLIRPPSSPTRIPSTGNRVSPASPSSSSTSTAAARRVVRATSSSNRENDESTFYPPAGRAGGGIIMGDFSPVRVPVGSAEDSVEDDPRGQVPQPTRSPPPIDFQLQQHPGADSLSTREVDHFSDVEPIQPGLQGVGEGAEDVEPRSGSSPGLYYEDPPPLRRYRGHRSGRTSFVDDYRQHSFSFNKAEGAAGAAVSVDSLFLDLENPKTLSLASPEREIANAIDPPRSLAPATRASDPETADGVQDEDQEDPHVLDNRSPLVENKTSDDLDHDLRSSTSSSTLLPTAAATSSAFLPATINSTTINSATAGPSLMSGESALAQAAVLATQTMQHHLNMSLKYVALLYHNLEVNQKIRSDSKEKDHLRGGSGSTSTSSACSSSRSSLQFQVHGHDEDEDGERSSGAGAGDSSAAPRAPVVSFPQRSAFSYNSIGKKSPGEDAPEQAGRAPELDLTSDGNYLTAVMLNSSLLKAMHVVETFQQHAVQVYSESNAASAGGGPGDHDDEEDGGAGDKREMGKPGVDLLSQVDDYVSFDGTLTTIYEGEDPESARVAYRNASKGLHTSDGQPNNVAVAGAATADEQSRVRDDESLAGAPDGGTSSSVVPSIFSLPQARKTLEKQDGRTFRERITTCESLHDVIQSLTQQHLQWKEEVLLLEQKKAELEQKVRKLEDEAEGESEEEHMVRVIKVVEDLTDAVEVQKSATAEAERSAAEARTHRVHLETMVAKISAALGEGRDLVTDLAAVSPDDGVRKLVTALRLQRKKVKSMQESFGALSSQNAKNGARSKDTSATSEAGGGAAAATLSEAETTTTATASATPAPVLTTGGVTKIDVASLEKLRVQELEQRYELLSRKYTELLKKKGASATRSAATTEQRGSAGGAPGPVILNTSCLPSRSSAGGATGNGSLFGGGSGYTNSQDSTPVANLKQQEPVVFDPQPRTPDITFTTGGGSCRGGGRRGVAASSRASAGLTMARERGAGSAPRAARTAPMLLQQQLHAALTGSSASSSSSKPPTAPATTTAAGVVPAAFGGGKKKEKPTSELNLEEIKALLAKTTKKADAERTNKNPRLSAPARGPAQKSRSRGITPQRKGEPASDRTHREDPDIVEILDGDDGSVEEVAATEYKTSGPQHNQPARSSPTAPRRKSPEQAELASASSSGTASLVEVEVAAAPRPPEEEVLSRVDTTTDTEELLPDSASASESIVVLEEQDRGGPGRHQRHQAKIKHPRAIGSLPMRTFGSGGGAETANVNPAFTVSSSSSHPPSMGAPANKLFSRGEHRTTTTSSSAAATSSAASVEQQRSRARNRSPLMSRLTSDMTSEEIADMARAAAKDPATFLACFRNRSPIPSKTSTTMSGGNTSTTSTTTYRCRSPDAGGTGPKARGRKAAFR